ncbi:MAG: WYL domain-containing protein [Deltaproteobacteria bacterium]
MNKFDRLLFILNKLDRRERVRVSELAKELEISDRTVYHYINSLMDADFPIYYDKDRGTYAFTSNFSLSRALLDTKETLVLTLAKRFLEPLLGQAAAFTLNQIENKIMARPRYTDFTTVFAVQGLYNPIDLLDLLKDLSSAIMDYRVVKIVYERKPGETAEEREVEPYFVFFTGQFWYVHTWCRTKERQRTFALHKIRAWQLTDRFFVPRKEVSTADEIQEAFGPYVDETPQEVIVHFAPEVKQYFLSHKWMKNQRCREHDDGWLEVHFTVRGVNGFKHWLYQWFPSFQVVTPKSLAQEVGKDLNSFVRRNKKRGIPGLDPEIPF